MLGNGNFALQMNSQNLTNTAQLRVQHLREWKPAGQWLPSSSVAGPFQSQGQLFFCCLLGT